MASDFGKYLTIADCTRSATAKKHGIDNTPNDTQIESMKLVAVNIFDKVKERFPNAFVNSFYRSLLLNKKVKGSRNSQHMKGEAIDIDSESDNTEIFKFVRDELEFDQLIFEGKDKNGNPRWVHVSYKAEGNRKQVLTII